MDIFQHIKSHFIFDKYCLTLSLPALALERTAELNSNNIETYGDLLLIHQGG